MKFETKAIRSQTERTQFKEHSVPMFLTSSFTFDSAEAIIETFAGKRDGNIYSRYSNPNTSELIQKVCEMEGAEAGFATASGMAAVFSSIAPFVSAGDHVLASRAVFGSTHRILTQILTKWNISYTYVDPKDIDNWKNYIRPNTKMILLETPSNPGLALIDLKKAGKLANKHKLILNVDNCFATPFLQNPIKYGAHLVTHSTTKWMDGQGRVLGGIIVGKQELLDEIIAFSRHTGPAMSPFNAWVVSKSLETLAVRMERHCKNAKKVGQFLENQKDVKRVFYPHLPSHPQYKLAKKQMKMGGGIVTFEVKGGEKRVSKFINSLKMLSLSSNLGDTRSIVTHPASTTHSKLSEQERLSVGITQGMIRISCGLEHIDDILKDIKRALKKSS